jgi:hypothetical protein
MAKYAVLDYNGIITNVIIADSLETANKVSGSNECISLGEGKMYDYWNGSIFISPGEEGYPIVSPSE